MSIEALRVDASACPQRDKAQAAHALCTHWCIWGSGRGRRNYRVVQCLIVRMVWDLQVLTGEWGSGCLYKESDRKGNG